MATIIFHTNLDTTIKIRQIFKKHINVFKSWQKEPRQCNIKIIISFEPIIVFLYGLHNFILKVLEYFLSLKEKVFIFFKDFCILDHVNRLKCWE